MSTTETESANQNSTVPNLIGRLSDRLWGDRTPCRLEPQHEKVFTLLGNSRRQMVVRLLVDAEGGMTIRELSERIAAAEEDVDRDDLPRSARRSVYAALHQTHLPKLEEYDAVSRGACGEVTPARRISDLRRVLQNTTEVLE